MEEWGIQETYQGSHSELVAELEQECKTPSSWYKLPFTCVCVCECVCVDVFTEEVTVQTYPAYAFNCPSPISLFNEINVFR